LKLEGTEVFDIIGLSGGIKPRQDIPVTITRKDGTTETITVLCRIDTVDEVDYYRHGGILQYVLRSLVT
jgi:aconitate hydratase